MKLSVIIPVYNEVHSIGEIIARVIAAKVVGVEKEIIVVDDFSTDGTREKLVAIKLKSFKLFLHDRNRGKGAALKTGLQYSTGDIVLFQDADLEYDPNDYGRLLQPIIEGRGSVVYGSRFLGKKFRLIGKHHIFLPSHYIGNKFLIFLMNVLYNVRLSDMETCYTVLKSSLIKSVRLNSDNFDITPELTAKILKRKIKIHEVPINYVARDHAQGKKISWRDGIAAAWTLIKYRFVD